jgi:hypothetical protein
MIFAPVKVHQEDADKDQDQNPETQPRDARRIAAISPGRDHRYPCLRRSLQSEYGWTVLVDEFDDPAAASGNAGQWIIGDNDR